MNLKKITLMSSRVYRFLEIKFAILRMSELFMALIGRLAGGFSVEINFSLFKQPTISSSFCSTTSNLNGKSYSYWFSIFIIYFAIKMPLTYQTSL